MWIDIDRRTNEEEKREQMTKTRTHRHTRRSRAHTRLQQFLNENEKIYDEFAVLTHTIHCIRESGDGGGGSPRTLQS